jgi:hypothetical protein
MLARRVVLVLLVVAATLSTRAVGQGVPLQSPGSPQTVRYLCLPHFEPPFGSLPSFEEIGKFHLLYRDVLDNGAEDLKADQQFARAVMGQARVLKLAQKFETQFRGMNYKVRVRFLHPEAWLEDIQAEVSRSRADVEAGPFVCQLGDTWAAHFRQEDAFVSQPVRYANDVRLLYYRKDLVKDAKILHDWSSFQAGTPVLRRNGKVPLAISIARDWDSLWNLCLFVYSAGGRVVRERKLLGLDFQTVAAIDDERGAAATDLLCRLVQHGDLELTEKSNLELTRDFLQRDPKQARYAMIIMEPWVAWQAMAAFGKHRGSAAWFNRIGAVRIPAWSPASDPTTFAGGSLLAIMDASGHKGQHKDAVVACDEWRQYLLRGKLATRLQADLQFLPADNQAWVNLEQPIRTFFDDALGGKDRAAPWNLHSVGGVWSPPQIPRWASAVESPDALDQCYRFWKRLSLLQRRPAGAAEAGPQREMVYDALHGIARAMNERLSCWTQTAWWLSLLLLILTVILTIVGVAPVVVPWLRRRRWFRRSWWVWLGIWLPTWVCVVIAGYAAIASASISLFCTVDALLLTIWGTTRSDATSGDPQAQKRLTGRRDVKDSDVEQAAIRTDAAGESEQPANTAGSEDR